MKVLHINSYCSDSKFYKNLFIKQENHGLENTAYIPVSMRTDVSSMDFGKNAVISKAFTDFDRLTFVKKHKKIFEDVQAKIDVKKYDLLHAHSLFSNGYIAYLLNKKYGIPYIVAVRDTDINFFFKRFVFMRKLGVEILTKAEKIIFISPSYQKHGLNPYVKNYLKSEFYMKSVVIPNGVDDFWIENISKKEKENISKQINVLCVARISKRKNLPTLVKACEKIKGHEIKLTIIGKVEDKREFKRIQKSKVVSYIPPCDKEKLIEHYKKNDVFALLSHTETFGIVYLESMSQGVPVVYTRGQGFDGQIIEGRVGYSSSDYNVNEISEKILKAHRNKEELSENCLMEVKNFNWDFIAEKYKQLYESIKRI